jgi:serine-type D-Ala-D-Ala carboxypeptidase/endopeptidase (penicillin-binding protein 4)
MGGLTGGTPGGTLTKQNHRPAIITILAGLGATALFMAANIQAEPAPASSGASETVAMAQLRTTLSQLVDHPARRSERWSILAVSLDRGDTLFSRHPEQPLAPASNMKLFTAAAALEYLGEGHRFRTFLIADGPIRDGVLEGNLYLYGTGDPTLGTRFADAPAPALLALADTLQLLGVRHVRGDIVGDGSYFSGPSVGEGWQESYMNAWYATSAGALSVHENMVRIEIRPGSETGHPELRFIPGGEGVALVNEATMGGRGGARVARASYDGPIVISGTIGGGTSAHAVPVGDPAMYAAALFRDVLADRQIMIHGTARAITDGEESPITGRTVFAPVFESERQVRVLAEHVSGPLQEILDVINQQSQNFYSEQVLRAVGRAVTGYGSGAAGGHAVKRILDQAGVDTTHVRIADGCGLSAYNQVSARDFITVLAHMADSPHFQSFMESLPVAGEFRRFRRMGGTPAAGNLRAKTGTITRVSALSGYVTAANGERVAFSIIGNDLRSVAQGKHIENTIGAQLASFDRRDGGMAARPEEGVAAGSE